MNNLISKIKTAGLVGRGGACYPVWRKWAAVEKAQEGRPKKERKIYVVCNASEGEPDVRKDRYILKNFPESVIDGIISAVNFLGAKSAFLYLKPEYFSLMSLKLEEIIGNAPIEVLEKPHEAGYIGGEESALLNAIEGRRIEPRLKPPFPVEKGLFGFPTLTHNVETFYNISRLLKGQYRPDRFYTITEHNSGSGLAALTGFMSAEGVFRFPENWTIDRILKKAGRYPAYKFFAQAGGGASGMVLNSSQLNAPVGGSGSITIFDLEKHEPMELIKYWINFFLEESCGKCTPCREGIYRIKEELKNKEVDWRLIAELLENLKETSFCGLGCAAPIAVTSYFKNVFPLISRAAGLPAMKSETICDCFSN